jgi:hypothetical protein
MSETIQSLVPLLSYQKSREHIFPSEESARWQVRKHKAELIEAGALIIVAGRQMVVPERFDAAVFDIGRRLAAKKAAA